MGLKLNSPGVPNLYSPSALTAAARKPAALLFYRLVQQAVPVAPAPHHAIVSPEDPAPSTVTHGGYVCVEIPRCK